MRRLSLAIAAVLTLSGAVANAQTGALPVKATASSMPLGLGETAYMSVAGAVRDVVVVDPAIADISIVNERTLIVMAKHAGTTTVMAFGAGGRTLASRQIVVTEAGDTGVTIYRGARATGYACASHCTNATGEPGKP